MCKRRAAPASADRSPITPSSLRRARHPKVRELVAVDPNDTHACCFAELQCPLPFDVDDRSGAADDLPALTLADLGKVKVLDRLRGDAVSGDRQDCCSEVRFDVSHIDLLIRDHILWLTARILPSMSLNHAVFAPPPVAMLFTVLIPGMSYSSKTTPRALSSATSE